MAAVKKPSPARTLLVFGRKNFRIDVPEGHRITFGPFSPPSARGGGYGERQAGTLRLYDGPGTSASLIAVWTGVDGYHDVNLNCVEVGEHDSRANRQNLRTVTPF